MADYTAQRALAERLIQAKGTEFTFSRDGDTPADANKPWEGNTGPVTGALWGVRVEPSSAIRLGLGTTKEDLVSRSQHILICAPGDGTVDPARFTKVTINGEINGITFVESLDPDLSGGIVYFVGAGR